MEYIYRIFCITDNEFKYIQQDSALDAPSCCPDSDTHEVNLDSLAIVDKITQPA